VKKIITLLIFLPFWAQADSPKTKFYDFDDLLINGEYKKPQIMYNDAQAKVRFERLFKIKKNFIKKLRDSKRDTSLR
jgi:predicted carbohydrate-binding protein with CBM5 and CBM33 domain